MSSKSRAYKRRSYNLARYNLAHGRRLVEGGGFFAAVLELVSGHAANLLLADVGIGGEEAGCDDFSERCYDGESERPAVVVVVRVGHPVGISVAFRAEDDNGQKSAPG